MLRQLQQRMQTRLVAEPREYLDLLSTDSHEAETLIHHMLISVTSFFREPQSYHALARHIPGLFKDKGAGDVVRAWVPGCASGEEAYSVAMLLLEHARTMPNAPGIQIFGSDLDTAAIEVARAGLYPEGIAGAVGDERLQRFFNIEGAGYRVRRELR